MKLRRSIFYVLLFSISFVFFAYISFPFTVLKEFLVTKVKNATGIELSIQGFAPKLPIGLALDDIKVQLPNQESGIELKAIDFSLSILSLFLGELEGALELESIGSGSMSVEVGFGIFDLIGGEVIPSSVRLEANKFKIEQIANFGLSKAQESAGRNAMVADLISKFGIDGVLSGNLDISLNASNQTKSKGKVDLRIIGGALKIDKSLGMASQNFEKALIKAVLNNGKINIDKTSGILTQGLTLDLQGDISLKKNIEASTCAINVGIALKQNLKDQFGFVIDNALGGNNGAMKMQIRGTLGQPNFVTL